MKTLKIIGLVLSLALVGSVGFCTVWTIQNWEKVGEMTSGTSIYNKGDLDNAYKDGYNTALENEQEYLDLIDSYKDNINILNDTIAQNTLNIADLTAQNTAKATQITNLNSQVTVLQTAVSNLNNTIETNAVTIAGLGTDKTNLQNQVATLQDDITNGNSQIELLNSQIADKQSQIETLTQNGNSNSVVIDGLNAEIQSLENQVSALVFANSNKASEIETLTNQIATLNANITSLQNTNAVNLTTIASLNNQIETLNSNINTLLAGSSQNANIINQLQSQIDNLQNSVDTYQALVESLMASQTNKVVVTFEFDGTVYAVQVYNINDYATVTTPTSTDYVIFNYWTADGEQVNLAEYPLNANTTFVANITKKYNVNFIYESTTYASQIVISGSAPTSVIPASTTYKVFNGWSLDGNTIINLNTLSITQDTTLYAVITYKYDAIFVANGQAVSSQIITKNGTATLPTNPSKSGYRFMGWSLNGTTVIDASSYIITENTTFTAVFEQEYTATFTSNSALVATQNLLAGETPTFVNVSNTDYVHFIGWTTDGNTVINVSSYVITANVNFIAKLEFYQKVDYVVDGTTVQSSFVLRNSISAKPTNPTKTNYEFDGWSIGGNIVNPNTYTITNDTIFTAVWTRLWAVSFTYESTTVSTQSIRNNSFATYISRESTNYKVFNGWTVDGITIINVNTYAVTQNTTFIASISYYQLVSFVADGSTVKSGYVLRGSYATAPTNPTKTNYEFAGWTINGTTVVNVANTSITTDTTFTAKFAITTYTATFVADGSTVSTQTINYGNYATAPATPTKTGYGFVGWTTNGTTVVNPANTPITANTTFTAKFAITYTVTIMCNSKTVSTQEVITGGYAVVPASVNPEDYGTYSRLFTGWSITSATGSLVNPATVAITANTTFYAVLQTKAYTEVYSATAWNTSNRIGTRKSLTYTNYNVNLANLVGQSIPTQRSNIRITVKTYSIDTGITFSTWVILLTYNGEVSAYWSTAGNYAGTKVQLTISSTGVVSPIFTDSANNIDQGYNQVFYISKVEFA
jgi:uncharacterized repeat protein (TIGR02543 family)